MVGKSVKNPSELTIFEAMAAIQAGELTSLQLVKSCLERIDHFETEIQAWAVVDGERALETAHNCDQKRKEGRIQGPLHGIPIGVKDIFYTAGIRTESGSKVCSGFVPDFDAAAVSLLKKAGAVLLGKTHTTEFALFDPAPTRNPWNTTHTPGGSSSGSAAAVAAGMCLGALGSQTLGSVLRPAAYNGLVGFKPHFGRISTYGVVPLSWTLDHVGLFAKCVEDAGIIFQAIAGNDPRDIHSLNEPVPTSSENLKNPKPPRFGVVRDFFYDNADEEMKEHVNDAAERLKTEGALVEEVSFPAHYFDSVFENGKTIMKVEAAACHQEMFTAHKDLYSPKIRAFIEEGLRIPSVDYAKALQTRLKQRTQLPYHFDAFDAFLTPAAPGAAPPGLENTGSPVMQAPWTILGVPTISLPLGLNEEGFPLGIQIAGPPRAEDILFSAARWCERILGVHLRPPL
ncbi:MAG: amidase [Candidatus Aminicenantes bacterium]|nr:amidase [Candidatus Aminicenantes bacterium]